jgi:hypothetical protein
MNIKEAREKDMVSYLSQLGYEPLQKRGHNYWYLSMLPDRLENSPSFKVNTKLNRWIDFGNGAKGNLVDFGILYHRCSVRDFLQKLESSFPARISLKPHRLDSSSPENNSKIVITAVKDLMSLPLLSYLHKRRIPQEIARQYCQEINYSLKGKNYYAIGFKNDLGGYEIRNEHFKGSSSPKGTTFLNKGGKDLAVFEGYFNFLSYQAMYYKQEAPGRNFLILNSAVFFEKSLPKMRLHEHVHLYLDADKTGQNCTQRALSLDREKFIDERALYQKYGDLNDWLIHMGLRPRQRIHQKL